MNRREKLRCFMRAHNTPTRDTTLVILSMKLEDDLPDFLADTEDHFNCPGMKVKVVAVLSKKGEFIRCMAFRGYDPENGYIAVSMNLEFGFSPSLHFVHPRRVLSTATRKVTEWRAQIRKEVSHV